MAQTGAHRALAPIVWDIAEKGKRDLAAEYAALLAEDVEDGDASGEA